MTPEEDIVRIVDDAFGHVPRPAHFTVADGDPECMDHDRLLHSHTKETLTVDDVGYPRLDPLTECFPEGIAYFFPALARFALFDSRSYYWYAAQLALHCTQDGVANRFLTYCTDTQKAAVFKLFEHIQTNSAEKIESTYSADEIQECVALWRN